MKIDVAISSLSLKHKPEKNNPAFWRSFNGSFRNKKLEPIDLADAAWNGHAFTAWLKNPWRHIRNYDHAQTLALDFDTGDKRSDPEYLYNDSFVKKYGSFIYTTFSHTPESPRCRVVFTLDKGIYQPKNFAHSAAALLWLFGGVADRASKDPVRGFFGGPPGETDAWYIGNTLPLELIKQIIKRYDYTGSLERRRHGYRHIKARDVDEQEIIVALNKIDPWGIDYDDWLHILMALHATLPDAQGLAIAERWAQGEGNEVAIKWRSFDSSRGITIATLFDIAKKFGYQPKGVQKSLNHIM